MRRGPVLSGITSDAITAEEIGISRRKFPARSGMAFSPIARYVLVSEVPIRESFLMLSKMVPFTLTLMVLPSSDLTTSPVNPKETDGEVGLSRRVNNDTFNCVSSTVSVKVTFNFPKSRSTRKLST